MAYRDMGFLPEAMVNYLVRLGWSHGDDEIFSRDELIEKFTIEGVGRSAGVFNPEKLLWLNAHYIKSGDPVRLAGLLLPFLRERGVDPSKGGPGLAAVVTTLQERARTMLELADGALFYYRSEVVYDEDAAAKQFSTAAVTKLEAFHARLSTCEDVSSAGIESLFKEFCTVHGIKMGQIGPVVRVALCGGTTSPAIYDVIAVLGRNETLRRLERAISFATART
jgi:glutamyl-tRNA synthetase